MAKKKIVAVIAAYNEEDRIQQVIADVSQYVDTVVVVDDGSTDATAKKTYGNKVILLHHACNLGQGAALQTGFEYAKKLDPLVVITYDADGQFNAKEIPLVIAPILNKEVDVVLGSRFLKTKMPIPFTKLLLLKGAIIFTYIFSSIKLTDTHNGFRALSKNALHKITILQNRMAHASEFIDKIKFHKLTYKEVPVTVKYDRYSIKKGQKSSNSFNIVFQLIFSKIQ